MMDLMINDASAPMQASRIYDIQSPSPMNNLKEIWILNTVKGSTMYKTSIFQTIAREQLVEAEECLKRIVLFWGARGVRVVLKDSPDYRT